MSSDAPSTRGTVVCLLTTPRGDADSIADAVIERKLAACVNIVASVKSVYWWKGKVEQDEEALLVLKTTSSAVGRIDDLLRTVHPYENFELISFAADGGSHAYLDWIVDSVEKPQQKARS